MIPSVKDIERTVKDGLSMTAICVVCFFGFFGILFLLCYLIAGL